MTSEEKTKFRATKEWKAFSKQLREERKLDQLTGSKLVKKANVHHMKPNEYTNLDKSLFITLNPQSHDIVEAIFRKKDWRNYLKNLEIILSDMEKYK